jgi:hypothetical protein
MRNELLNESDNFHQAVAPEAHRSLPRGSNNREREWKIRSLGSSGNVKASESNSCLRRSPSQPLPEAGRVLRISISAPSMGFYVCILTKLDHLELRRAGTIQRRPQKLASSLPRAKKRIFRATKLMTFIHSDLI